MATHSQLLRNLSNNVQAWEVSLPEPNPLAWSTILQLTMDLIAPEKDVAEPAIYQHPLKNFRDLAIANGTIFKQDDMGALREAYQMQHCVEACAKHCLSGNYRLFSISEISSGRTLATAGIMKEDNYWKIDQIKGRFNQDPDPQAARLGLVIQKKYMRQEELISIRKARERKQLVKQLREKHQAFLCKRHKIPGAYRAGFSHEEIDYLERHAEWLSGLVSGELQPNACEQVRFIAVTNGVLRPRTEAERIWVKYRRLGYTPCETGL